MNKEQIKDLLEELSNNENIGILPIQAKYILNYIEYLEKRNKEIYDGFLACLKEINDCYEKIDDLENKGE